MASLFSTVNESVTGSVTLPSGYDLKRQLPIAVRNDGSSNIIPFRVAGGWPQNPLILYNVAGTYWNGSSVVLGTTNVLNAGSASSYTAVSLTSFVPPLSRMALINFFGSSTGYGNLRATGESHEGQQFGSNNANVFGMLGLIPTNSSQSIDYKKYGGSLYLDVAGFVVTEM